MLKMISWNLQTVLGKLFTYLEKNSTSLCKIGCSDNSPCIKAPENGSIEIRIVETAEAIIPISVTWLFLYDEPENDYNSSQLYICRYGDE